MSEPSRIEMLQQILSQTPEHSMTRYALAMEYSNAGEVEKALGEFKTLIERDPNFVNGYFMAAQMLQRAERFEEAKKILEDGIAAAQRTNNRHAVSEMQALLDELEYQ